MTNQYGTVDVMRQGARDIDRQVKSRKYLQSALKEDNLFTHPHKLYSLGKFQFLL